MLKKFQKHLDNKFPYLKKSSLLIACSGGLDSTVLAHLFEKSGFDFSLAHCNFNLRDKESDKDETFVKNLGSFLNSHVYTTRFKTEDHAKTKGISIQMAARELRYNWFEKIIKKHKLDYILTAHHKDDVLETFLINLTRGTGIDGLTGIPEKNQIIIRPLLPFTRKDIYEYAKKNDIIWREDESNSSKKYLRNRLRHDVVPILKELNPSFLKSFHTTLENLQETQKLAFERVEELKKDLITHKSDGTTSISIAKVLKLADIKANLYQLLKPYGFKKGKEVYDILEAQSGKQLFSKSHRMLKNRDELIVSKIVLLEKSVYEFPKTATKITDPINLSLKEVVSAGEFKKEVAFIDKNKLKNNITVRKWKKGDYFYPIGMHGKKKLSNFFKDSKLSILEKEATWLLCDGENIIWVMGYRLDDRYKITKQTKEILEIKLTGLPD